MIESVSPVKLPDLPSIDEVEPISEKDHTCIREIRAVLEKHKCRSRFGITLLHRHFDVGENELLVEECDQKERLLSTRPVLKTSLSPELAVEASWRLDTGEVLMACETGCYKIGKGMHDKRHHRSQGPYSPHP